MGLDARSKHFLPFLPPLSIGFHLMDWGLMEGISYSDGKQPGEGEGRLEGRASFGAGYLRTISV